MGGVLRQRALEGRDILRIVVTPFKSMALSGRMHSQDPEGRGEEGRRRLSRRTGRNTIGQAQAVQGWAGMGVLTRDLSSRKG